MPVTMISVGNVFMAWDSANSETILALNSYGSLVDAEIYFNNRLRSAEWHDATIDDRKRALVEATECIDKLNFIGTMTSSSQLHAFPRNGSTNVPTEIERACYEIAIKLLEGYDPDMEVENLAAQSQGYSSVRATYDRAFVLPHLRAGIVSNKAWQLLTPWITEKRNLKLRRVT